MLHVGGQLPVLHPPSVQGASKAVLRALRVLAIVALIGFTGWAGLRAQRQAQQEADLVRFRTVLDQLTATVRNMPVRAVAKHHPVQLRIDAAGGVFRLSIQQGGRRPYETLEQTIWLPAGLEITESPDQLTAGPNGRLSEGTILLMAPAYNRIFRLTASASGSVRLDEESSL